VSGLSRRALLGAGAFAALGVTACGDRTRARPRGGDAGVLGRLLAVEDALTGAWAAMARLPGADGAVAHDVLARQRDHVTALAAAGARRGAAVPPGVAGATRRARLQARAHHATGALDALLAAGREAAGAHLAGLPELLDPDARALVLSLFAAAAQHEAILLSALGRDPLPDAFAGTLA
jgi:hypothetical protein